VQDRPDPQRAGVDREPHRGHVQRAVAQRPQLLGRGRRRQVEPDGRAGPLDLPDHGGHRGRTGLGQDADAQPPGRPVRHLRGPGHEAVHRRQHVVGRPDQRPARRGQAHLAGRAVEQAHAQIALEALDALRQRRLRHVQAPGGPAEVQLLGHDGEVAQVADQVDGQP